MQSLRSCDVISVMCSFCEVSADIFHQAVAGGIIDTSCIFDFATFQRHMYTRNFSRPCSTVSISGHNHLLLLGVRCADSVSCKDSKSGL
jgi:hypothetical protein